MKSRLKRGLFPVLLSILLLLGTMTAFAETTTDYGLDIGEINVTSANEKDVLGDGGTVTYDAASKTLTLNNAEFSKHINIDAASIPDLVINVVGENTINSTGDGIGTSGNLTLKGNGVLNLNATATDGVVGIRAKNVTVDGIKLNIDSSDSAIYAEAHWSDTPLENDQTVTIRNGAEVKASSKYGYGIFAMKDINILDSSVTVMINGNGNVKAIYAAQGKMTIDTSVVDAQQTSEQGSMALRSSGDMKITKS